MSELRILLSCGAGMSSGFLASRTRKAAKKRKLAATIEARSVSEISDLFGSIDILLLGPHYANELAKYEETAAQYGFPVAVIPQDIYAQLDGEKLLDLAIQTIESK